MTALSFDARWSATWVPTGQPAVFDVAMRELAAKAWAGAANACAKQLEMTTPELLLLAGELSANEILTVKAVLSQRARMFRAAAETALSSTVPVKVTP